MAVASAQTQKLIYVPPEGIRETARIAIVGEAPGAEEEKLGRPFIGQSGQLVRGCITASTVPATRLLITNAVDRKSTRLNSSHVSESRMPSSA